MLHLPNEHGLNSETLSGHSFKEIFPLTDSWSFHCLPVGMQRLTPALIQDGTLISVAISHLVPQKTDVRGEICVHEVLGGCIQKEHHSGS